ncbi:MAG TPA: hypothetical protein VF624_01105 [Tepidisphaeraceae bacterium]|jgi:hypothetical protein
MGLFVVTLSLVAHECPADPRAAIPTPEEQKVQQAMLVEMLGRPLRPSGGGSADARATEQLRKIATSVADDPAAEYVVLTTLRDFATAGGDVDAATGATVTLAEKFGFDAAPLVAADVRALTFAPRRAVRRTIGPRHSGQRGADGATEGVCADTSAGGGEVGIAVGVRTDATSAASCGPSINSTCGLACANRRASSVNRGQT